MFFDGREYRPLPHLPGEGLDVDVRRFASPQNLDYVKFRGRKLKKGLSKQYEPSTGAFEGLDVFENSIKPAYRKAVMKVRPICQTACQRFNSERLVEDVEDDGVNNREIPPRSNKENEDSEEHEDCVQDNLGHSRGRNTLKKVGSFFKSMWKPVKRSVQKVCKMARSGECEYVRFE
ncbi:uncharacterized protein LOC111622895 [Centruroides sculpturatus]|uniref:uncharacterized protein LOC111622895 n=1 Tax=Centruroides sculpturatus TaxID=218467 RepID=UPI000C6E7F63|nr:uncharacterized protein LOC111622895 [Centruroides sculpturatus]XP_023221119.1 uncharacterized protein LOC111622895 [Centruroides sculpturatus]XP_023221120.1 uncharacterized protein LOC111622895 [Centruroides sculpturatus]